MAPTAVTRGADHFDWPRFFAVLGATGYDGAARAESLTAKTETIAIAASVCRLALDGLGYLR
ncbi:hypothetical protein ACPCHT_38815 [Nucisporomicrobium flavum]|uniref:hypothetical protein n=1 Tax=Nucisporomicrobium flavum TaxID=2785915 RepID=UPI003C2B3122